MNMLGVNMLLTWRDRLLSDSGFQRWSARFPLTRQVARREARALFDICAGFTYSQVLAACVELDLFDRVAAGPMRLDSLAQTSLYNGNQVMTAFIIEDHGT